MSQTYARHRGNLQMKAKDAVREAEANRCPTYDLGKICKLA